MNLTDIIAVFAPNAARRMVVGREHYRLVKESIDKRQYDAARMSRLTRDWRASFGSADRELVWDLLTLRNRSHDLFRNNPYAASVGRQLTANIVGTGIRARAQHPSKLLARKAQVAWDNWRKMSGFDQAQKIGVRSTIEGGDIAMFWRSKDGIPDSRVDVLEGEYIDHTQNGNLDNGGRRVMGVEFNADGDRVAYALFKNHPGDILSSFMSDGSSGFPTLIGNNVVRVPAEYVDHVFETLRPGQTRGIPWLSNGALKLRELDETAAAIRIKKRIEACLGIFRSPSADDDVKPLGDLPAPADGSQPQEETLRPGMIITGRPGEKIDVINPSSTGDSDTFYRNEIMAFCASLSIPYHLATGDVSQANYSSLRAATIAFWAALDDWQQITFIPKMCDPAFARVMRREALLTGDKRYLQVTAMWTPPARAWVDPLKDIKAQAAEMRLGLSNFAESCAERGLDWRDQFKQIADINAEMDKAGIILDFDPRKVNGMGQTQQAAAKSETKDEAGDPADDSEAA